MIPTYITGGFQQYPPTLSQLDGLLHGSCFSFTGGLNLPTSLIICFYFGVLLPNNFGKVDYLAVETHACFLYCVEKLH